MSQNQSVRWVPTTGQDRTAEWRGRQPGQVQRTELMDPSTAPDRPGPAEQSITDHALREGRKDDQDTIPTLQDATFLNAVLPFAVGQARRHGESLSLLCVAVDRLGGIRELLGGEIADRAVSTVGRQVAELIRSSDIVARIDDDRIIAVLPRAPLRDAECVARRICRHVESSQPLSGEVPALTVSIGVADFPACATTVYALLDAADHALFEAQRTGRNRAVPAAPRADSTVS